MPVTNFKFIQPFNTAEPDQPDPTFHTWEQFSTDGNGMPMLDDPWEAYEVESYIWLECALEPGQTEAVRAYCEDHLVTIDETTGYPIYPTDSEVFLCMINNENRCFDVDVHHPFPDGWIQVRACGDESLGIDCSAPATASLPEPSLGAALMFGVIMLAALGRTKLWRQLTTGIKAIRSSRK